MVATIKFHYKFTRETHKVGYIITYDMLTLKCYTQSF